ncbi:hypothetical protein AB2T19_000985 [Clostridium botulinum]|nr:hypothetical protein [Clostridium sporogenes]MCW6078251.1 hypothetical protein [Clostridium sporogenes]
MANGKFARGDGTEQNPYLIEDAFDLNNIRQNLKACYKLINNIDLNINPYNTKEGWVSIGDWDNNFTGIFDGNGYNIKNLYINNSKHYQGLFGFTSKAIIKNLGVVNTNINVSATQIGAIVGSIRDCSIVSNCYSTGSIVGEDNVGGLVGLTRNNAIIMNSYSLCNVTNTNTTQYCGSGGLVGNNTFNSTIKNCYSIGKIVGNSEIGGLVGREDAATTLNSYWDLEKSQLNISKGGIKKTTLEMKNPLTFINWDKEKLENSLPIWILQGGQYPKLWFQKSPTKFLISQNSNYYSTKSNFINLGQPKDNTQLENWYNKYGADDVNIITQNLNNKEFPMTKNENGIWKTDFQLDMNEVIDNIELVDIDEENKSIKYNCNDYRILDLCDDQFKLTMCKSK